MRLNDYGLCAKLQANDVHGRFVGHYIYSNFKTPISLTYLSSFGIKIYLHGYKLRSVYNNDNVLSVLWREKDVTDTPIVDENDVRLPIINLLLKEFRFNSDSIRKTLLKTKEELRPPTFLEKVMGKRI